MKKSTFLALTFLSTISVVGCGSSSDSSPSNGTATGGTATTGGTSTGGTATGGAATGGAATGGAATGGAATGGAATGGTATGGGAGAASCTDVTNTGTFVPETAGVGAFPAPTGGTIVDGDYELTKFEIFSPGSVDDYTRKETLQVAGLQLRAATQRDADPEARSSGTFTTTATEISAHFDCPVAQNVRVVGYTATPTQLIIIISGPGINEVHTYVKR